LVLEPCAFLTPVAVFCLIGVTVDVGLVLPLFDQLRAKKQQQRQIAK